jgi:CheY-like chemotaxis protein
MKKQIIVIVEDDESICEVMTDSLSHYFEVHSFGRAELAIDYLASCPPLLAVIADFKLPGSSGIAVATAHRNFKRAGRDLGSMFIMSGYLSSDNIRLIASAESISSVFAKPFSIDKEIIPAISSATGWKQPEALASRRNIFGVSTPR